MKRRIDGFGIKPVNVYSWASCIAGCPLRSFPWGNLLISPIKRRNFY
jgi:hypothetical protein